MFTHVVIVQLLALTVSGLNMATSAGLRRDDKVLHMNLIESMSKAEAEGCDSW
jgi:hypothetical protein